MLGLLGSHDSQSASGARGHARRERLISILTLALSLGLLFVAMVFLFRSVWYAVRGVGSMESVLLSLVLMALSVLLVSLLRLDRRFDQIGRAQESILTSLAQSARPAAGPSELVSQDVERLGMQMEQAIKLLQDVNENTLLDEPGRRRKQEFLAHQERRRLFTDIDRLVQDREWAQAKALLEGMRQKYPQNTEVDQYAKQVEELRKQAFNEELVQTRKRIADLIAISAWDKAIRQADLLLEKHPDMAAARELQLHVRGERSKFREEQIKHMYADIQRSIGKKRWNDALQVARQLTEKYPARVEAETLVTQLATLEQNAEIEKRQDIEEQIKDLIHRRNFIQARELARYVLEHYPNSPQANALRSQIEKMEYLARQQEKELRI